jgi:hypothetical protein
MRKFVALGFALLALTGVAYAFVTPSASYEVIQEDLAAIDVQGDPSAMFRILGEQPSGSYQLIAWGHLDSAGSFHMVAPMNGPINHMPQFRVAVRTPEGDFWINLHDKEYAFD